MDIFDYTIHPTKNFNDIISNFEPTKHGINIIGGFGLYQNKYPIVFKKVQSPQILYKSFLVDLLKPLFGIPSNGEFGINLEFPQSFKYTRDIGEQHNELKNGLYLIQRRIPAETLTDYTHRVYNNQSKKLWIPDDLMSQFLPTFLFRMVTGITDPNGGNFLIDKVKLIYSIDETSAFSKNLSPFEDIKIWLSRNLAGDEALSQISKHLPIVMSIQEKWKTIPKKQIEDIVNKLFPKQSEFYTDYIMKNIDTLTNDFKTLVSKFSKNENSIPIKKDLKEMKDNIGIIFHWGLYSIPAYDDITSARRRSEHSGGGAEWIQARLEVKPTDFRPPSGWKNAQKYFAEHFPNMTYKDLKNVFMPSPNFDEWMRIAKDAGASYVILTTRHHDGFALWPSKTTPDWSSKTDYVKQFKEAAQKYGLKWGVYYSFIEFKKGFTIDYINTIVKPELDELKQYNPDIWWFDGHWNIKSKTAQTFVSDYVKELKREYPLVQINDRLGEEYKTRKEDLDWLGDATFRNFEDRYVPSRRPTVPWEHITTIGLSWGRNLQQQKQDYKTGEMLYESYKMITDLGGRFLINLGPDAQGNLDPNEVESLNVFGKLVRGSEKRKVSPKREVQAVQKPVQKEVVNVGVSPGSGSTRYNFSPLDLDKVYYRVGYCDINISLMKSGLQKEIRRDKFREANIWGMLLLASFKIENLYNRILTIASEDISIGNLYVLEYIYPRHQYYVKLRKEIEKMPDLVLEDGSRIKAWRQALRNSLDIRTQLSGMIRVMSHSPKTRICDHINGSIMKYPTGEKVTDDDVIEALTYSYVMKDIDAEMIVLERIANYLNVPDQKLRYQRMMNIFGWIKDILKDTEYVKFVDYLIYFFEQRNKGRPVKVRGNTNLCNAILLVTRPSEQLGYIKIDDENAKNHELAKNEYEKMIDGKLEVVAGEYLFDKHVRKVTEGDPFKLFYVAEEAGLTPHADIPDPYYKMSLDLLKDDDDDEDD